FHLPIGHSSLAQVSRWTMQCDVFNGAISEDHGSFDRIFRAMRIASTNLNCQWNGNRFLDLLKNRLQPRQVAKQRRAATMFDYFRSGTTAIDVENVGAYFFSHFRRHAHAFRLGAENLNSKRSLGFIKAHLPFRFWIVASETFNGNKFRNRQTDAPAPLKQPPKRDVGNACHW